MSGSARPLTYVPLGRIVPKSTGLADSEVVILDRRTHVFVLLETLAAYYEEEVILNSVQVVESSALRDSS